MSFFKQTLKARLNQNKDKYPLLKLNELLDWTVIADILRKAKKDNRQSVKARQLKDGIMYKAVRGQSLSDSEKNHNRRIKQTRWVIEQSFAFNLVGQVTSV